MHAALFDLSRSAQGVIHKVQPLKRDPTPRPLPLPHRSPLSFTARLSRMRTGVLSPGCGSPAIQPTTFLGRSHPLPRQHSPAAHPHGDDSVAGPPERSDPDTRVYNPRLDGTSATSTH